MNDIRMAKVKNVGDSALVNEIEDGIIVLGIPSVVKNPMTGELEDVKTVITTSEPTYCPKCGEKNMPGIEITVLKSSIVIYGCKMCNQYIWCRPK